MTTHRAIFSGSGGQGLMFIGKLLANLAMDEVPYVTFLPSYGAEVRGGTSNCQVTLSDEPIASPRVETADAEILMNQPSVDRFLAKLTPGGRAFINSTMASADGADADAALIPATQIALDRGDVQAANVVMLGAYLRATGLVDRERALAGIEKISQRKGERAVEINAKAFDAGWEYLG